MGFEKAKTSGDFAKTVQCYNLKKIERTTKRFIIDIMECYAPRAKMSCVTFGRVLFGVWHRENGNEIGVRYLL